MSKTTATTMAQSPRIEDYILLLGVILGAGATFFTNQSVTIFGLSPFLLGAIAGSLGKGLAGLGNPNSYEDWILVVSTTLGTLATALSNNAAYAVYGLVIGQIGKAVLSFQGANSTNIVEDALLFIMAVITAIGQAFGYPTLVNLGLFLGAISKALPSLGLTGIPTTTSSPLPTPPSAPVLPPSAPVRQ